MGTSLLIESIAPTGEGVARHDGRAVFVRGALPGERVEATIGGGRVLRGQLKQVIDASDDRVEAPCPHAAACGGCDLMHARVEAQRDLHRDIVRQAVGIEPVHAWTPPSDTRYRTRARLAIVAKGDVVRVGYRRARSREICDIDSCLVLDERLERAIELLRRWLVGSHGEGEAQLALGPHLVIELRWKGELGSAVFSGAAEAATRSSGNEVGVRIWADGAAAPAVFGDPQPVSDGADGEPLWLSPGGFAQASIAGGAALAKRVAALAGSGGRIVELFAGSGTLTVLLARQADQLIAVEQDASAAEVLRRNLRARALTGVKVKATDANAMKIPRPVRCVVLDPPRAGAAGAIQQISKARPQRVVYVSCNPISLGRDARALGEAGFSLDGVELFELFPHTSHVETLAHFSR